MNRLVIWSTLLLVSSSGCPETNIVIAVTPDSEVASQDVVSDLPSDLTDDVHDLDSGMDTRLDDGIALDALAQPAAMGQPCRSNSDCISGLCLVSEFGPPFCTRACSDEEKPCAEGEDVPAGRGTLCVGYDDAPNPQTPAFKGDLDTFCVLRCTDDAQCTQDNPNWERCDVPKWLGDPLYPNLGSLRVCQAPSYHGKEPVDPASCDWEKTRPPQFITEANLCRSYCAYLEQCDGLSTGASQGCCEWGCFNRMIQEGTVQTAWFDQVKCHVDVNAAYPTMGPQTACSEPPVACCPSSAGCPDWPVDPTPPAAKAL